MSESNLVQDLNALKLIPGDWTVHAFNSLVSDVSGGNTKLAKSNVLESGSIAVIDQGKDLVAGYYNDSSIAVKSLPPYIVFGDHTRAFKYVDFPFIMGADGTKVLKPKNDSCLTKYLFYFFLSINVPDTGYNRHFKYLKQLKIPLPPLEEQKKIAAILDAADDYRQKTKALIDKYDQLTQSLFLDMFGDPVTNPMGFSEGTIGDFTELITYGLTVRPEYHSEGIPLISAREIRSGTLDLVSAPKIGVNDFKRLSEKGKPLKGDILFSKTGSIGNCAIVEVKSQFAVTQNAARIVFMETVNRTYALYFLRSPFIQTLSQIRAKGNAVKDLQLGEMKKFKFILPPSELQHQFAERVEQIEKQKQLAEASLVKAEELFSSLLQRAFKQGLNGTMPHA